jgi:hypothetical protein
MRQERVNKHTFKMSLFGALGGSLNGLCAESKDLGTIRLFNFKIGFAIGVDRSFGFHERYGASSAGGADRACVIFEALATLTDSRICC